MLKQDRLHLGWHNGKAFVFDHLLFAVDDVNIAIGINTGDIPRIQPTIAYGPGRLFRRLPIALHHVGPFDNQLAKLTELHLSLTRFRVDHFLFLIGDGQSD